MHAQIHTIAFRGIETIADLAGDDRVGRAALAEALAYWAMPLLA